MPSKRKAEPLVYMLYDPILNEGFYVGFTNHLKKRLSDHCGPNTRVSQRVTDRIYFMHEYGVQPEMLVLEKTSDPEREKAWIQFFSAMGLPLLNVMHNPARSAERKAECAASRTEKERRREHKQQQVVRARLAAYQDGAFDFDAYIKNLITA